MFLATNSFIKSERFTVINWKEFFKPSDFPTSTDDGLLLSKETAAALANAKLWAVIQCQDKVYGDLVDGGYHGNPTMWNMDAGSFETHAARIICIEKIQD